MSASIRLRSVLAIGVLLVVLVLAYGAIFLRFLPNAAGGVGNDYSLFIPMLMAGLYWFLGNGPFAIPWFSPSICGGVPFFADPQVPWFSIQQALTFIVSPVLAIQVTFIGFAAAGFLGMLWLARGSFGSSRAAAALAGGLFMFNAFYASRMLVGHLTYHPFMLLPAMAAALLPPDGTTRAGLVLRLCGVGLGFAYMIQAGAIHLLPPALLCLAILIALHASLHGWRWRPVLILAASLGLGLALCASKIVAFLAFLGNFPRDQYPLPGIASLPRTLGLALRTLFFTVPDDAGSAVVNSIWAQDRHEWEYGVSPIPLLLIAGALAVAALRRRRTGQVPASRRLLLLPMAAMLAVPVLLNWYQPDWNAFLKALPFFGSSSNLLRWFCVYIPVVTLGAALAFDRLLPEARLPPGRAAGLAALAIAAAVIFVASIDHGYYGPEGTGTYRVQKLQDAHAAAMQSRTAPPVTAIVVPVGADGKISIGADRDDALAQGMSELICYAPIFGYRLENFPMAPLHPGPALQEADGVLNVKNPACYVFPQQNGCVPGGQFSVDARADATAFLQYRPFPFQRPRMAKIAGVVNLLALGGIIAATLAAGIAALRRPQPPRPLPQPYSANGGSPGTGA